MISRLKALLLENATTKQTVAKNIFWLSASQVGTRLLRALVIIYAARVLGASEYGVFSYVLGLAGFFSIFADIGMSPILTKEIAKKPEQTHSIFATAFWIKAILLAITVILIIFIAPFFSKIPEVKPLLLFAALLTLFDGVRDFSVAYFRAKEKMEIEALITTITNVAITIFGFIILRLTPTASALALTYALSAGTGTLLGVILLQSEFRKIFISFKKNLLRPMLELAWPIALTALVGVFMTNIDIVMLGFYRTAEEVGYYSAGQKIIQILFVFPGIIATSFFPTLSKYVGANNNSQVRKLMEKGVTLVFILALPLTIGGVLLAQDIISFVYGAGYTNAILSFQVLLLTLLPGFPAAFFANQILVYNKQKVIPFTVFLTSVINIVLNVILIPVFGIVGSAAATVVAQVFYQGRLWHISKSINNFNTLRYLNKTAIAALTMGIVAFVLHKLGIHVLINISLSAVSYILILFLTKEQVLTEIYSLLTKLKPQKLPQTD